MADPTCRQRPRASGAVSLLLAAALILVIALIAFPGSVLPQQAEALPQGEWNVLATHGPAELGAGDLRNLSQAEDGLSLGTDQGFQSASYPGYDVFGVVSSSPIRADGPFGAVRVSYDATTPDGTTVEVEVRVQTAEGKWSQWQEVESSGDGFSAPARGVAAQYRATLLAGSGAPSPRLRSVRLEVQPTSAPAEVEYQAMVSNPTVRLYGTREGLVGRVTSNGHRIVEKDHFVALPSKKALNPKDSKDYQVQISYKGKTATAPVWDVGPWNSKDDYWNSPRELFNDLPRFTPQVHAAFFNNHNNGNDMYGRPVIYPASIDIADGTFIDDLGMKSSDWVDVTFLWIDAAAPPLVPMPAVVPKKGPIPQPIFKQAGAPELPPVPPTPTPIPKTWYFAEGSTNKPFDSWLLLQNPDPEPANVKVTYMLPKGGQQVGYYALKPTSRMSLFLNNIVPNTDVSALVESDRYILAERAVYFGSEGHDTAGTISPDTSWYFAEGNTKPGYETWVLMQNPNTTPATATLTFFKDDGTTVTHKMLIPHVSRESLMVNLVVPDSTMGTRVEADKPIVVERAVYKDRKAGAVSMGATDLSTTWYLAEGNTRDDFDSWLLMMNPNDNATTATVTYMPENGSPVTRKYDMPARTRISVSVDKEVPNSRVGMKIEAGLPIVAERTTYFASGSASHNSVAAPQLAKLWYLPEGSTAKPFWENVLVMNPNSVPANVTATFMKEDGTNVEKKYTVNPTSRFTIEVNNLVPDSALSTKVTSDQPVVVERSMYLNDFKGGTSAVGIPK